MVKKTAPANSSCDPISKKKPTGKKKIELAKNPSTAKKINQSINLSRTGGMAQAAESLP
jgi:hypothetical protein